MTGGELDRESLAAPLGVEHVAAFDGCSQPSRDVAERVSRQSGGAVGSAIDHDLPDASRRDAPGKRDGRLLVGARGAVDGTGNRAGDQPGAAARVEHRAADLLLTGPHQRGAVFLPLRVGDRERALVGTGAVDADRTAGRRRRKRQVGVHQCRQPDRHLGERGDARGHRVGKRLAVGGEGPDVPFDHVSTEREHRMSALQGRGDRNGLVERDGDLRRTRGHAEVDEDLPGERPLEIVHRDGVGTGPGVDPERLDVGGVEEKTPDGHVDPRRGTGERRRSHARRDGRHRRRPADGRHGDQIGCRRRGHDEGVCAGVRGRVAVTAADERIGAVGIAGIPGERVAPRAAEEVIDARAAKEGVVAGVAIEPVRPLLTGEAVVASPSPDEIVPLAADEDVVVVATVDRIIAIPAIDGVLPGVAGKDVVTGAAVDPVVASSTGEDVVEIAAEQIVVPVIAEEPALEALRGVGRRHDQPVVPPAAVDGDVLGDGTVDRDLVVVVGTDRVDQRHFGGKEVVCDPPGIDPNPRHRRRVGVRPGEHHLLDGETVPRHRAPLVLRREIELERRAAQMRDLCVLVIAVVAELRDHAPEQALAGLEERDLATEQR